MAKKKYQTISLEKLQEMSPQEIGAQDSKLLFHTYQRYREVANKRLKALANAGFRNRQTYKNYREMFAEKPSTLTDTEIKEQLLKVRVFLDMDESSVKKQKAIDKKIKESAKLTFGSKEWQQVQDDIDLERFGDFMDTMRATSSYYLLYESDDLEELWNIYKEHPDIENFADNPLTQDAWNKFISSENTKQAKRARYKTRARKDSNTINSDIKRLARIRERKRDKE